ncbi:MAG TPA: anti-sigma factor [Ktedonobacteraceae bacterium]|nr:anti-sigma factor [Ktedonobacteraceae bacterium]
MNCTEMQRLLHAYLDNELDVVHTIEVEQHLAQCKACSQDYQDYQALRTAISTDAPRFQAPELLQKRIRSALRKESKTPVRLFSRSWLSIVAALACVLLAIWGLTSLRDTFFPANSQANQLVSSHLNSLLANHLVDVPSSDQHTVKPWFDGKLSFSPAVVDLAAQGYPLLGGRLDYINNTEVAAIVYKHRKHIINLFVWPVAQGQGSGMGTETLRGYNLIHWTQGGLNYWAVSDLDLTELQQFATLIQQHAGG